METAVLEPGQACALVLIAAIAGGLAARMLRFPRVVGYLVAGLALRAILSRTGSANIGEDGSAEHGAAIGVALRGIKTLALGMILFRMGSVFQASHIKGVGARVWRISVAELGCVFFLVAIGCWLASAIGGADSAKDALALGLLLGCVALATAPAATMLVLREYDAKGPVGDTILTLTAINNTASIVLFHVCFLLLSAFGMVDSVYAGQRLLWLDLLLTTVGSVAVGVALGFCLSIAYSKMSRPEFLLVFLAVLLALGESEAYLSESLGLSFNFLLVCLSCGAIFANITIDQELLQESLHTVGGPIFAAFFVLAGYDLHVNDLATLGWVGAVYVIARTAGKVLGGRLGTRSSGEHDPVHSLIGLGMLCQAGVAIGLADFVVRAWGVQASDGYVADPSATLFRMTVLGSVVIFELVGPLALKNIVVKSGEVKAVSLLRRRRAAVAEGDSILKWTTTALLRTLGLKRTAKVSSSQEALETHHIMRPNVKLLRASMNLDEVLHFVESSRFNHFPVVDEEGNYVGMIHFSDIREIIYDPQLRELVTAADLADASSPTVSADLSLQELLKVFHQTDFGSLAVVEGKESRRVVGLVEQRDLLKAIHVETKTD